MGRYGLDYDKGYENFSDEDWAILLVEATKVIEFEDVDKDLTLLIAREPDPVRKNLAIAKKDALRMIHEGYNPRILKLMLSAYFDVEVTKDFLDEDED